MATVSHAGYISYTRVALDGVARAGVGEEIARRYRAVPVELLTQLHGHFALAVLDERTNEALLAIDRMSVHDLSFYHRDGGLVFASNANAVRLHPAVSTGIDHQAIFNYLYCYAVPGPRMAFTDIARLPPGHYLRLSERSCEVEPYWRPEFNQISTAGYARLRGEFRQQLDDSVRRAGDVATCGTFLSDGTDSSTVTGYAQTLHKGGVPCFSIGFAAEGYDEMAFARTAAKHFHAPQHEYYITPRDIADAIPLIAGSYEQPYGNSSAVPTYYCAKLAAEHGVKRLLAGDGGDELFGGNERYAKQFVFSLYDRIPALLRRSALEPPARAVPAETRFTLARKYRRYVEQAKVAMPLRMETYNLLSMIGVERILNEEFLARVDANEPHRLLQERYALVTDSHPINRMLSLDFQFTLADNDLRKVSRMCDRAGVEVGFHLLDDTLVAFSTRLPYHYKLAGTRLRPFFKRALSDFLPQQTINKSKYGFGLSFGLWLESHEGLRDSVNDALGGLRSRGIVREEFVDHLNGELIQRHAKYYGNLIWVLVMLEQWYRQQIDLPAAARYCAG